MPRTLQEIWLRELKDVFEIFERESEMPTKYEFELDGVTHVREGRPSSAYPSYYIFKIDSDHLIYVRKTAAREVQEPLGEEPKQNGSRAYVQFFKPRRRGGSVKKRRFVRVAPGYASKNPERRWLQISSPKLVNGQVEKRWYTWDELNDIHARNAG